MEGFARGDEVLGAGSKEAGKLTVKSGRFWFAVLCTLITYYGAMTIFAIVAPASVIHSIAGYDWATSFNL
jgi:hypothetical protein